MRAIRAQTFSLVSRFVGLARLSGKKSRSIIVREIAPNMSSYLFLVFILLFGGAILVAASFDFLGFGPPGGMLSGSFGNRPAAGAPFRFTCGGGSFLQERRSPASSAD